MANYNDHKKSTLSNCAKFLNKRKTNGGELINLTCPKVNGIFDWHMITAMEGVMRCSMAESRDLGRFGWWTDDVCTIEDLEHQLHDAVAGEEWEAVMIYSAMIQMRKAMKLEEVRDANA